MALITKNAIDTLIRLAESAGVSQDDLMAVVDNVNNQVSGVKNMIGAEKTTREETTSIMSYKAFDIAEGSLDPETGLKQWGANFEIPDTVPGGIMLPYLLVESVQGAGTISEIVTVDIRMVADLTNAVVVEVDPLRVVRNVYCWILLKRKTY